MLLQNRDEHIGCRYYANGNTALFGRRCFVAGERLPAINRNKGVMMYVVSGSVEIEMSRFVSDPLGSRTLFFLPQNIPFYGRVVENLELCTCTAPPQIPLCGRYDLMDLQQDMANLNNGKIPPPPPPGKIAYSRCI